jgi:hypothetical protein
MRPVSQQETIEYPVTVFEPQERMETVSFYEYAQEPVAREEQYIVDVPQTRMQTREVTMMRTVPVQQQEQYTVMVPYQEQIQVPVARYVSQPVIVPVQPSCSSCAGGY